MDATEIKIPAVSAVEEKYADPAADAVSADFVSKKDNNTAASAIVEQKYSNADLINNSVADTVVEKDIKYTRYLISFSTTVSATELSIKSALQYFCSTIALAAVYIH